MPFQLVSPSDVIPVAHPPLLVYGQPGVGKTSLASTCDTPLTLDFDGGAARSSSRRHVLNNGPDGHGGTFPLQWEDVIEAERQGVMRPFRTLVVDTAGKMLDSLARAVIRENPKNGSLDKGPYRDGWTAIKARFAAWVNRWRSEGVQLVFIAHEKEDKEGDTRFLRPSIPGGSYATVMENCDLIGYLSIRGGKRVLDFNPTDAYFGKNPCGWRPLVLPDFAREPHYCQGLLEDTSKLLGRTAAASAEVAKAEEAWAAWLKTDPNLEAFNGKLPELSKLGREAKGRVWEMLKAHAAVACGAKWEPKINKFVAAREPQNGGAA